MFVGLEFIDINLYTDKVPMVERINIKNKDNKIHIRLTVEYIFSIKSQLISSFVKGLTFKSLKL